MLDGVINSIVASLESSGINAVKKYPAVALDRDNTVVCVSLRSAAISASGCGNYIGLCSENGIIKEMLGSRGKLGIGLEIYCPSPDCELIKEQLLECLAGIGSLSIKSFDAGEICYDSQSEMYRCECTATAVACLVRQIGELEGSFELEVV